MPRLSRNALLGLSILTFAIVTTLLGSLIEGSPGRTGSWAVHADASGFRGEVTDLLTKLPIAGAQVSAGDLQATTDAKGRYSLPVAPGTYEVRAQAPGYIGMSKSRQTANPEAALQVNLAMVVAEPSEEQRAALDAVFRQEAGAGTTADELQAQAKGGIAATAVGLPAFIRVLMPDGVVVVMSLDEYVKGVVPHEMAPYWPTEALKAQAVAARCYAATARRHTDVGADVCTTVHCQVWSPIHYETTDAAVDATHNVAAAYGGGTIHAYFFAHCDGHTRNSEEVWGTALPYCRSVSCPCGFGSLLGHGVGMCQEGARVMAANGADYRQILTHYYSGVQVSAPPSSTLGNGHVQPLEGDTATLFTYEAVYAGSDAPIAANLYIDDYSYNMDAVSTTADGGTLYRYSARLQPGSHTYAFHFEDGYYPAVNLPASGSFGGPNVRMRGTQLPSPTPQPTPEGTQAGQWSQTTWQDFSSGEFLNTVPARVDNGELTLAPGSVFGQYTSTLKLAPVDFVAVGSRWQATTPAGTVLTVALRSSADANTWSRWTDVRPMDAQREETRLFFGELVYLRGPYVQYRITLASRQAAAVPILQALTLIFIDSRRGPTAAQAQAVAILSGVPAGPLIIPRSAWGAEERLMTWPPEYRTVRKIVVHHTATPNNDLDPAATVRAIYYYHAVTRGWGDIGYNYLIDGQGRIYEGRFGGEGVVGGHAKQYAWGSIGVSLIGDYEQVDVSAAMQKSLIELLAWKGNLHFVHPTQHGFFIDKDLPNIMGHRDGAETECPGKYAYARLPGVRQAALARMAELPPNVRIDVPAGDQPVGAVVNLAATGSPAVTQVTFLVDGAAVASDSSPPFSCKWNSTTIGDGRHSVKAHARTASGLQAECEVAVLVDNTPPNGSVSGPLLTNVPTITLTTLADGAQWMLLSNGWLWEGEDLRHQSGRAVSDTDALNGQTWAGRARSDQAGWWYGPYLRDLPTGRSYRVYFRLKSSDSATGADLASLDVADNLGMNTYISHTLTGQDFARSLAYQEPYLDFSYYRTDNYGLEFRTFYVGSSDLYLDRVHLFYAPRAYGTRTTWTLPAGDGSKRVYVRYLDAAGNASEVYSVAVLLDTTPPEWLAWNGNYARVRDEASGLHVSSAVFVTSSDGGVTWGAWQAATITSTEGTLEAVSVSAPAAAWNALRFRIEDRAGNRAESPAYVLPTPTPSPSLKPSATNTPTPTATATPSPTVTSTPSPTPTHTPVSTSSPTPAETATESATSTPTASATPTSSPTATPNPSATYTPVPPPALGSLRGRVLMQGRTKFDGATLRISDLLSISTGEDGRYALTGMPEGTFTLTVYMAGYLQAERREAAVVAGAETALPDVTLYGGDANGDCSVNLSDLVLVSSNFGGSPPRDSRADINADGRTNLQDLLLVAINLGQSCPSPW